MPGITDHDPGTGDHDQLDVARRVARDYDDIAYDESIVDATAMKLVMDPSQFDVLVMENLFGDTSSAI